MIAVEGMSFATPELIVQIRRLLAAERRAGRLVCRYLADLADRIHGQRDRELLAYVDEFQASSAPAVPRDRSSDRESTCAPAAWRDRSSDGESTWAPARREQLASAERRRAGHAWGDEASASARRELQSNHADIDIDDDVDAGVTHVGSLNENALRLLQIMGRRGNWTTDVLIERSALPFSEFQHALPAARARGPRAPPRRRIRSRVMAD